MIPLVVGFDPGTTSAFALLSVRGEVVCVKSVRNWSQPDIVSEICSFGQPILVGGDKKVVSSSVGRLGAAFGAKVVMLQGDLGVGEKRELCKGLRYGNDHERDALAAARVVFLQFRGLFEKVDRFLVRVGKEELGDRLKGFMVKHSEMNMVECVRVLEKKPAEMVVRVPRRKTGKQIRSGVDVEMKALVDENERLKKALKKYKLLLKRVKRKPLEEKSLFHQKEQTIRALRKRLAAREGEVRKVERRLGEVYGFVSKKGVLVKKLENFTKREFRAKSFLKISEGDLLFVRNPSECSRSVLDSLRGLVTTVITPCVVRRKDFVYVQESEVALSHIEHYALVSKSEIEKAVSAKRVLQMIVDEYEKEKK